MGRPKENSDLENQNLDEYFKQKQEQERQEKVDDCKLALAPSVVEETLLGLSLSKRRPQPRETTAIPYLEGEGVEHFEILVRAYSSLAVGRDAWYRQESPDLTKREIGRVKEARYGLFRLTLRLNPHDNDRLVTTIEIELTPEQWEYWAVKSNPHYRNMLP